MTRRGLFARPFVRNFVVEAHRRSTHLAYPDLDGDPVVVVDFAPVLRVSLDAGEHETHVFHLLVGKATRPAPGAAGLLEPEEVVRVVGVAHLVRFAVPDPDAFDGGDAHRRLAGGPGELATTQ